ncbi:MAG TPA: L,D-transpeptidase [Bacteroidales bacterium]|nr:L,D-transpeptidase [Bacteroidales bacterium]
MEDINKNKDNTPAGEVLPDKSGPSENKKTYLQDFFSWLQKKSRNKDFQKILKPAFRILTIVIAVIAVVAVFLYLVPALNEMAPVKEIKANSYPDLKKSREYRNETAAVSRDIQRLERKYNVNTSGQSYIVINTTDNRFCLYRNKKLIREGFCSSGSYTLLKTDNDRKWIFKTPKGKYWVRGKTTNPVWKRPDWSFVEEGLPIPPADDQSRYEYGVLGDYALSIGDGYLIHGTIYKRFLGMPVTHGCVRLNDDDLKVIFNTLSVGSKVYIF